jgi:hypothetical protein
MQTPIRIQIRHGDYELLLKGDRSYKAQEEGLSRSILAYD